jgi:hypothetical protein
MHAAPIGDRVVFDTHDAADRIRAACDQAGAGSTTDIGSQIAAIVAG